MVQDQLNQARALAGALAPFFYAAVVFTTTPALSEAAPQLPACSGTPIHDIQGPSHFSPLVDRPVGTCGVVTAVTKGGFFLQTPAALEDEDPRTSEGIFVASEQLTATDSAVATVAASVYVKGTVREYIPPD